MWNDKKRAPQSHKTGRNALLYDGTACRGSRPAWFFLLTAAPPRGFEPPENRGSTVCRQLTFACIHRFISTAIPAASNIRRGEIILLFCGELQSAFLNSLCAINNFIACMIRKVEPEARYRAPPTTGSVFRSLTGSSENTA